MKSNSKEIHTSFDNVIYVTDSKTSEIIRIYKFDEDGNKVILYPVAP